MSATYYIIAGEVSGDKHGAVLMQELKLLDPHSNFHGVGGKKMTSEGLNSLCPIDKLAVMGFWEVLKKLLFFSKLEKAILLDVKNKAPDQVILIDYPGLNLRLAKKIKKMSDVFITFYIAPQVWAWKEKRTEIIRNHIDKLLVIFPFEKKWFKNKSVNATYVGHPILDEWKKKDKKELRNNLKLKSKDPLLVLFPGSRRQELLRHLKIMMKCAKLIKLNIPNLQIVLGLASGLTLKDREKIPNDILIESNNPIGCLECADAAIVASGTATLEAAVFNVPSVIIYKSSFLSWLITKFVIKTKTIGMANLIANKMIMPEYLQYNINENRIAQDITSILSNKKKSLTIKNELTIIKKKLGRPGATSRAANIIYKNLKKSF